MTASVQSVYQICKDWCMKQQHGFVTPAEFNVFARNAQNKVFKDLITLFRFALSDRNRFMQYSRGNYGGVENIKDDLRPCLKEEPLAFDNGVFLLPEDYAYYVALYYQTNEVDVLDKFELGKIQNSYSAQPTQAFPVGTFDSQGVKVLPNSGVKAITDSITLHYYKYPQGVDANGNPVAQSPTYATTTVNDIAIFNASDSVDFELGQAVEYKLAIEILGYIGLNIREQELIQWSMIKQQEQDQKQS